MRHMIKGLTGALVAISLAAVAADTDFSEVEQSIRSLAPGATSIAISETPIEGLLMVQIEGDIAATCWPRWIPVARSLSPRPSPSTT